MSYSEIACAAEPCSADGVSGLPAYTPVACSKPAPSKPGGIAVEPGLPHEAPPGLAVPGWPEPTGLRAADAPAALQQPSATRAVAIARYLRIEILQSIVESVFESVSIQ
jgi:hypothetical protein